MSPAIEVQQLVKHYGRVTAVDGVSLSVTRERLSAIPDPTAQALRGRASADSTSRLPDLIVPGVIGVIALLAAVL